VQHCSLEGRRKLLEHILSQEFETVHRDGHTGQDCQACEASFHCHVGYVHASNCRWKYLHSIHHSGQRVGFLSRKPQENLVQNESATGHVIQSTVAPMNMKGGAWNLSGSGFMLCLFLRLKSTLELPWLKRLRLVLSSGQGLKAQETASFKCEKVKV
jgi:hypothetical protein